MSSAPPPIPLAATDRTNAMICHLAALAGYVFPLGNVLGPLIWWNIKKKESAEVDWHGKEALNFQIGILLCDICFVVLFLLPGKSGSFQLTIMSMVMMGMLHIFAVILTLIYAFKANEGIRRRYPIMMRIVR